MTRLLAALLWLFPAVAMAVPLEVDLVPDQYVYVVGSPGFQPDGFNESNIDELNKTIGRHHYKTIVFLVETIPGSRKGDSDTRRDQLGTQLLDDTAEWLVTNEPDLFNETTGIFILGYKNRPTWRYDGGTAFRGAPGSSDMALGFQKGAHAPYTRLFLNAVQQTPKRPATGIRDMLNKVDSYLWSETSPAALERKRIAAQREAERQARLAEQRKITTAQTNLTTAIAEAEGLLSDPDHLPGDATEARVRTELEAARAYIGSDDYEAVRPVAASLTEANLGLSPHVTASRAEARREAAAAALGTTLKGVFGLVFGGLSIGLPWRRKRQWDALRQEFEFEADDWASDEELSTGETEEGAKDKVGRAKARWLTFANDRQQVVGLSNCTGQTAEDFAAVAAEMDAIYVGIEGIRQHVRNCRKKAAKASIFNMDPMREALDDLTDPFDFDTGEVNRDDLFGTDTKTVRVDPVDFERGLAERFKNMVATWDRLLEAAKFRNTPAKQALPTTSMIETVGDIAGAEIGPHWIKGHPLADYDTICRTLDDLRRADPRSYAARVDTLKEEAAAYEARVANLIKANNALNAARNALAGVPFDPMACVLTRANNPVLTEGEATNADMAVTSALQGSDFDIATTAIDRAAGLYRKVVNQRRTAMAAQATATKAIATAQRDINTVRGRVKDARATSDAAASRHGKLGADVVASVRRGNNAIDEAMNHLDRAEREATGRKYLEAITSARAASSSAGAAGTHFSTAHSDLTTLDRLAAEYDRVVGRLQSEYDTARQRMGHVNSSYRRSLNSPSAVSSDHGYRTAIRDMESQISRWNSEVRRARSDQEDAERRERQRIAAERRRREQAARAAREAAERRRRSSYSSSSGGGFGGGGSSSSGGGFGGGGSSSSGGGW